MNMINVLSRLAELDAKNSNVAPAKIKPDAAVKAVQQSLSEELSMDSLRYLSGVKETLEECGMMPGMSTGMPAPTPASFSINASAATGDEVASMLTNIMTLAGMHKVGAEHMPAQEPKAMSMVPPMNGADSMKKMLDVMNDPPEDESIGMEPEMGDEMSSEIEPSVGGETNPLPGGEMEPEMGDDTPDISGVGGALAGAAIHGDADGAKKGMEDGEDSAHNGNEDIRRMMDAVDNMYDYDNKGADANAIAGPGPNFDSNQWAKQPTGLGVGRGVSQAPHANSHVSEDAITDKLFDDYKKFIGENTMNTMMQRGTRALGGNADHVNRGSEDGEEDIDQFVNGNRKNFNGTDEEDFDKAQQMFVNFLKKKGIDVDDINREAYPVLVAMCQGKMCAWYDLENAYGYVAK